MGGVGHFPILGTTVSFLADKYFRVLLWVKRHMPALFCGAYFINRPLEWGDILRAITEWSVRWIGFYCTRFRSQKTAPNRVDCRKNWTCPSLPLSFVKRQQWSRICSWPIYLSMKVSGKGERLTINCWRTWQASALRPTGKLFLEGNGKSPLACLPPWPDIFRNLEACCCQGLQKRGA